MANKTTFITLGAQDTPALRARKVRPLSLLGLCGLDDSFGGVVFPPGLLPSQQRELYNKHARYYVPSTVVPLTRSAEAISDLIAKDVAAQAQAKAAGEVTAKREADYLDTLFKPANYDASTAPGTPGAPGAQAAPQASIWDMYSLGEQLSDGVFDGQIGGFSLKKISFKSIGKAIGKVTQPVSKALGKIVPKPITKFVRYAGAAAFTTFVPFAPFMGGARNKMFGLKGNEQKAFNVFAKVGRGITIAAGAVAAGAVVGPAAGGAMGHLAQVGATVATKAGALAATMGKDPITNAVMKGAKFLIKDSAKDMLLSVLQKPGGGQEIEGYPSSAAPELYNSLPDATPIPYNAQGPMMDYPQQGQAPQAPAGAGTWAQADLAPMQPMEQPAPIEGPSYDIDWGKLNEPVPGADAVTQAAALEEEQVEDIFDITKILAKAGEVKRLEAEAAKAAAPAVDVDTLGACMERLRGGCYGIS